MTPGERDCLAISSVCHWAMSLQLSTIMSSRKCFVYVLQSVRDPSRYYTGLTSNISSRLAAHNAGACPHTASARPWHVVVFVQFVDEHKAVQFERYLKSGSGSAFAKRHFR